MYTLGQAWAQGWGKLRRTFLIKFRKKRVLEKLDRRKGACSRCGACCKLLLRCPAYDDSDGDPKCLVYNDRPGVCGLFPLDEKDLRERDIVMPDKKCGFYFSDEPNGKPGDAPRAESMPLRWGPDKKHENGKRKFLTGGWAVLPFFFRRSRNGTSDGNGKHVEER